MSRHNRGEIWLIDLGYVAKIRPCLILSIPFRDDERALVTVVPHTTATRGTDFEVVIAVDSLKAGAFDVQNIMSVSAAKLERKLGTLKPDQITQIETVVREYLGL